jgi:nucleoside-diphosphate-sugar epimerase
VNKIGILGCGWLGTPLALKLISQKKWTVKVSKTTRKGVNEAIEKGLNCHQVVLLEKSIEGEMAFFNDLDQLVVALPPKRNSSEKFSEKIGCLVRFMESKNNCKIIFLSSTSVYGNESGRFDETSQPSPQTEASVELLKSEKLILESLMPSVIVRLGGLVGEDRNPIFKMQDKVISNPKGILNFIPQLDAVGGILALLSHPKTKGLFNLVSPHHPTRSEYYFSMSKKYNLPTPKFATSDSVVIRRIEAKKIQEQTNFRFQVDNLFV